MSKEFNRDDYIQKLSDNLYINSKLFSLSLTIIFSSLGAFIGFVYSNIDKIKHIQSSFNPIFIITGLIIGMILGLFISYPISLLFKVQSRLLLIQYEILNSINNKKAE